MMRTTKGAALKLVPIAMVSGLLTACGQPPAPTPAPAPPPARTAADDLAELHALKAGIEEHPSMVNPKDAGRPIHVNLPNSNEATK